MRSFAFLLLLLAACAGATPGAQAQPPSPAAPVDGWPAFEATVATPMRALAHDVDCNAMAEWCAVGQGWDAAPAIEVPPGDHLLGGLTLVFAGGEPPQAAFKRPIVFSALALSRDAQGVRVRLVSLSPGSPAEIAEASEAVQWFVAFLMGDAEVLGVVGGLATHVGSLRGRADTVAQPAARGLRFVQPDGTLIEMRRVGKIFVVVARPPGSDGVMISLLTDQLHLDPAAAPRTRP